MFASWGKGIARGWPIVVIGWVAALVVVWRMAPDWNDVAQEGQFGFLPKDAPSRQAERLYARAFPQVRSQSSVALVLDRTGSDGGLRDEDRVFIRQYLSHSLRDIAEGNAPPSSASQTSGTSPNGSSQPDNASESSTSLVVQIRSPDDPVVGPLLLSHDGRAALVVVELAVEFTKRQSHLAVDRIEHYLDRLKQQGVIPAGLEVHLTGSATLGRDETAAKIKSADAIQSWTILLVIGLLLVVYRAPFVALIPLASLYFAVTIALKLLALLAGTGTIGVFQGLQVYTTVIVYGAGVDYSLFLLSRCKEHLDAGAEPRAAVAQGIHGVGTALVAAAATEVLGIGMLVFASFGKFQEAGVSIAFGLLVMLAASMSLTPALLCLAGRFAFWPRLPSRDVARANDSPHPTSVPAFGQRIWDHAGRLIGGRPKTIGLTAIAALAPFAVVGLWNYDRLTYGLIDELPKNTTTVVGIRALERHFPVGATAPVAVLLESQSMDFRTEGGIALVGQLADHLAGLWRPVPIADVRSVADPLGTKAPAAPAFLQEVVRQRAIEQYVSGAPDYAGAVTRLDLTLDADPFARETIDSLDPLREAITREMPAELRTKSKLFLLGPTASLADLKAVAQVDRARVQILVTAVVLGVLILLLRGVAISTLLVVTVLFTFLTTFGITFGYFQLFGPEDFSGLDWTVSIFLFIVLVAVGVDYNIFLVTRVDEEQARHGAVAGVVEGLVRTGGIISGCGFIMAGTFSSLAFGGMLAGLYQLGFALAVGILLDTFVVRPIIVPAYLIAVNDGSFGSWSRYLGARPRRTSELTSNRAEAGVSGQGSRVKR